MAYLYPMVKWEPKTTKSIAEMVSRFGWKSLESRWPSPGSRSFPSHLSLASAEPTQSSWVINRIAEAFSRLNLRSVKIVHPRERLAQISVSRYLTKWSPRSSQSDGEQPQDRLRLGLYVFHMKTNDKVLELSLKVFCSWLPQSITHFWNSEQRWSQVLSVCDCSLTPDGIFTLWIRVVSCIKPEALPSDQLSSLQAPWIIEIFVTYLGYNWCLISFFCCENEIVFIIK